MDDAALPKSSKRGINMKYLVIFIVITLLFAIFASWVVFGEDVRDWRKTHTHITEFERTLTAIDDGILKVEQELGTALTRPHRVALHSVRARYLETRTNLLYHINNVSPPHDYSESE